MSDNSDEMFIFCESSEHQGRRIPITKFRRAPAGLLGAASWHEKYARRSGRVVSTGYTLHGASVDEAGWANNDAPAEAHRVDHDLTCFKCRKPWTLNEEKLHRALDAVHEVGVSELSLVQLAAIVAKQAKL